MCGKLKVKNSDEKGINKTVGWLIIQTVKTLKVQLYLDSVHYI